MRHFASAGFWEAYRRLPENIRLLADKNYALLKQNPQHPSLHLKKVGRFRSVRIGARYRALAVEVEGGLLWFWIRSHGNYDALIGLSMAKARKRLEPIPPGEILLEEFMRPHGISQNRLARYID